MKEVHVLWTFSLIDAMQKVYARKRAKKMSSAFVTKRKEEVFFSMQSSMTYR